MVKIFRGKGGENLGIRGERGKGIEITRSKPWALKRTKVSGEKLLMHSGKGRSLKKSENVRKIDETIAVVADCLIGESKNEEEGKFNYRDAQKTVGESIRESVH